MRIKVCGLTRRKDVELCCRLGIDALGFIFADSPRQVSLEKVEELTSGIPPFVSKVAVVMNPEEEQLEGIIESGLFDYIQFHGEEDPDMIAEIPLFTLKAISVGQNAVVDKLQSSIEKYEEADFYLFDSKVGKQKGGTGKSFNWDIFNKLNIRKPFILAGGIGPDNLEEAVNKLDMVGLDINSKIEVEPGIKDHDLLMKTINFLRKINMF
ncbi:MAG: phosphoribosylanthranilate isomerase [Bacillota bacterium]